MIVQFEGSPGKAGRDAIKDVGGKPGKALPIASAIAAEVPADGIAKLKKNPRVTSVEPDAPVDLFDHPTESHGAEYDAAWGVEHYGADDVHASGNTGAGINVAVIDSGVDYNHPDLDAPYVDGIDLFNNDPNPMDDNGHGTHVSGTIAAELNGQKVVGAAPGVNLYAVKVVDANGNGDYSNLIAGLNWVHTFNLTHEHGIDVVNMSLGGNVGVERARDRDQRRLRRRHDRGGRLQETSTRSASRSSCTGAPSSSRPRIRTCGPRRSPGPPTT